MLDPVVIILSLIGALTCAAVYIIRNPEFRAYVRGAQDADDGAEAPSATEADCR